MNAAQLLIAVFVPTAAMVALSVDGLIDQVRQARADEIAEAAEAAHQQRLARRRRLYALRHLPTYRISVQTISRKDIW